MLLTRYVALIPAISFAVAPLLAAVGAEEGEKQATILQETSETLAKTLGTSSFSIHQVAAVKNESLSRLFPQGRFVRASVDVVVDPVTKHGALLEFVIYSCGDVWIVLPMSGDRSGFAELCKKGGIHLHDSSSASQLADSFAAIYRLAEPVVRVGGGGYLVRFGLPAGAKIRQHRMEIAFRCDEREKVVEVTETRVPLYIGDADAVSVEKIKGAPEVRTSVFALKRESRPNVNGEGALKVKVPETALTRIAGVRFEGSKTAVVVQLDEFYLEYREYDLVGKGWKLSRKARLCNLNGALSLRLKEVEMERFGEAVVRFGRESQLGGSSTRELAVVAKAFPREKDDIVESYRLKGERFVEVSGVRNRFRPRSRPDDD